MPTNSRLGLVVTLLIRPGVLLGEAGCPRDRGRAAKALLEIFLAIGIVAATVQIFLLDRAVANTLLANPAAHVGVMRSGLLRLIVLDRLLPPPTMILSGCVLGVVSAWSTDLEREKFGTLGSLLVLAMAPVIVLRIGELGATIAGIAASLSVGDVMVLPGRFVVGPRLLAGDDPAPWVYLLDSRANLITVWVAALWVKGLGDTVSPGQRLITTLIVVLSMLAASLVTWSWGPPLLEVILRGW